MTNPSLTAERADAILMPKPRSSHVWGAKAIASFLNVSAETVRSWAKEPAVPIYQPRPRCYFADTKELEQWLHTKPAA